MTTKYKAAGMSDKGPVKEENQDTYLLKAGTYNNDMIIFAMVADGMGGLSGGKEASGIAAEEMDIWFENSLPMILDEGFSAEALFGSWEDTVAGVSIRINEATSGGTTMTMALLYKGMCYTANIGDSRIYRMGSDLVQMTTDHSWEYMARLSGMSDEEIAADTRKNMVTKCVGAGEMNPAPDFTVSPAEKGTVFLLCSDGLRRKTGSTDITDILKSSGNTKEKTSKLISVALDSGETDNITAVVVEVC